MFRRSLSLLLALIVAAAVFAVTPAAAAQAEDEYVAAAGIEPEQTGENETEIMTSADEQSVDHSDNAPTREGQLAINGGYLNYSLDPEAGTVIIIGGAQLSGDLAIPSEIDGYPVTAIADAALTGQNALSSVTVPDSVKSIGATALGYDLNGEKLSGFTVKAKETGAAADYADENGFAFIDIDADKYPHITSFENTETGVKIKWDAFAGAEFYRVYYKNNNGGWTRLTSTAQREYVDTSAKPGETRTYTVRALKGSETFISEYSRRGWSSMFIEAPTVTLSSHEDGVMISWKPCAGAERYRIYYYGKKGWTRMVETDEASYLDTDVRSGNSYTYTVRCISADSADFTSDYRAGKKISYVAAPRVTSFENLENGTKIKWDAVKGADLYRVYYKNNSSSWTRLASMKTTEYTDTSVKPGEVRVYTIRCLNNNEDFVSDFVHQGFADTFIEAPTVTLSSHEDGVMISWKPCAGAERYRIYYYGKKGWTRMVETDEASYLDTDVRSGNSYTYTVRCISADSADFTSDYRAGKKISYVAAPRVTSFENLENGAKIKWDAVKGADLYRVYYKNNSGSWTRLASMKTTEYTDTSVKPGEVRVYTIRCLNNNEDFVSDFVHQGFANLFYAPPEISSVSASQDGSLVEWNAGEGVAAYRLYRKTLGGSWSRLFNSTDDTSYLDTDIREGDIYAYTLRYLDEDGSLISAYLDDVRYYQDGNIVNGKVEYGNNTYFFDEGYLRSGLKRINGKLYYYSSSGKLSRDTIVKSGTDYYYADKDGVCCESEEIRLAAAFMAENCKGSTMKEKMKNGFMYLANNYPYKRYYDPPAKASDIPALAVSCFKNHNGNCYRYAAAFCCLARMAGYRARVGVGITGSLPHGWTEVYVDGKWLICDVDANIPTYNVPAYHAYMMKSHYWSLKTYFTAELTIENGKAVWK